MKRVTQTLMVALVACDPDAGASEDICSSRGDLSAHIHGADFGDHEGRTVWTSAIEDGAVDMMLSSTVVDGAFVMQCDSGLSSDASYPSYAVVIDADNSGACSDDDIAFVMNTFTYGADLDLALQLGDMEAIHVLQADEFEPICATFSL